MRQRLGKRAHSPEKRRSVSPVVSRNAVSRREPLTDVRSRLGVAKHEGRSIYTESSKDKKTGTASNRTSVVFLKQKMSDVNSICVSRGFVEPPRPIS